MWGLAIIFGVVYKWVVQLQFDCTGSAFGRISFLFFLEILRMTQISTAKKVSSSPSSIAATVPLFADTKKIDEPMLVTFNHRDYEKYLAEKQLAGDHTNEELLALLKVKKGQHEPLAAIAIGKKPDGAYQVVMWDESKTVSFLVPPKFVIATKYADKAIVADINIAGHATGTFCTVQSSK